MESFVFAGSPFSPKPVINKIYIFYVPGSAGRIVQGWLICFIDIEMDVQLCKYFLMDFIPPHYYFESQELKFNYEAIFGGKLIENGFK